MKIKLIANPKKKWAINLAAKVLSLLKKNKHKVVNNLADITVCIGGDGTILHANFDKTISGSVLAIGSDSSHMCQINKKNWKKDLLRFLRSKKRKRYPMLKIKSGKKTYCAVNDVVIHTHDYRVIEIMVLIRNSKNNYFSVPHKFEGDGIIVSSSLGSTSYAYSAGGKIIVPATKKVMELVPICPYKRRFKPHIFDRYTDVLVSSDRTCDFIIDGILISRLKPRHSIHVSVEGEIEFVG